MINHMECTYNENGDPEIRLFHEKFGFKASDFTASHLAYCIDFWGGPAPVITGNLHEFDESFQAVWDDVCERL